MSTIDECLLQELPMKSNLRGLMFRTSCMSSAVIRWLCSMLRISELQHPLQPCSKLDTCSGC